VVEEREYLEAVAAEDEAVAADIRDLWRWYIAFALLLAPYSSLRPAQSFAPEKKDADWVKVRSITEQNDLDG
jgi:hypothetical protein